MLEWPLLDSMTNSVFNIVKTPSNPSTTNIEMVETEDNVLVSESSNNNVAHSSASSDFPLQAASENGGKSFNIFIQSMDSKTILDHDSRAEIKTKINHAGAIDNVRYTKNGSIIFSTVNVQCAVEICQLLEFSGVSIKHRVIWENVTNKFLIFNIPVDIP